MIGFRLSLICIVLVLALPGYASSQQQYADCKICHKYLATKKSVHPPVLASCVSCHVQPHRKEQKHAKGLSEEGASLCFGCHNKAAFQGKYVHSPVELEHPMGPCTTCHNPHSSENPKLLEEQLPELCYRCHSTRKFAGTSMHVPVERGMCTSCHFPHQAETKALLKAPAPALCFLCHSDTEFKGRTKHVVATNGRCSFCHTPHASDIKPLLLKPENEVCAKCHKGIHVWRGYQHPVRGKKDPNRKGHQFSCTSCHNPHSSDSPKLFRFKANSGRETCKYCHKH